MPGMVEWIFVCASFSKENQSRFLITARDLLPRGLADAYDSVGESLLGRCWLPGGRNGILAGDISPYWSGGFLVAI